MLIVEDTAVANSLATISVHLYNPCHVQCTTAVDDSHCRHQGRDIPSRGPHKSE